jgi:hypothetical protein
VNYWKGYIELSPNHRLTRMLLYEIEGLTPSQPDSNLIEICGSGWALIPLTLVVNLIRFG